MRILTSRTLFNGLSIAALLVTCSAYAGTTVETLPQAAPVEARLLSHRHYTNRDGRDVHAPARSKTGQVPAGATAQCRDGSYSFSRHHRGTCSRHGGVAQWE